MYNLSCIDVFQIDGDYWAEMVKKRVMHSIHLSMNVV